MNRYALSRAFFLLVVFLGLNIPANGQTFSFETGIFDPPPPPADVISAVSIADFNGDGRLDYYHPGSLYRQEPNGMFKEVRELAGISYEGEGPKGGVFADANLDGLLDLLIFDVEPGSRLFLNRTGGKFELGNIATNIQLANAAEGGFWRDLNKDGWPDLAITYNDGNHALYTGFGNSRFSEQGSFFNFRTNSPTCNISPGDFDNDGDVDIFGAGCVAPNSLLTQTGSFRIRWRDQGQIKGVDSRRNSEEGIWLDYDNDGWLDLLVINNSADLNNPLNQLYHNDGSGNFVDVSEQAGIGGIRPLDNGPATVADFNNDGWVDIYVPINTNGRMYINNQDGTFTDRFEEATGFRDVPGETSGSGDFNNDGWIDLLYPQSGILYNNGGDNNWVTVQVKDDTQNRFGVGATVRLTTEFGTQVRTIEAGSGGLGHGDQLKAHFGLGSATEIQELTIDWSFGPDESYTDIPINEHLVLVRGLGLNTPPAFFTQTNPPVAGYVDPTEETILFEWEPSIDDEPILYTLSLSGPGVQLSFPNLETTFFELSTQLIPANQAYEWSVIATDGHTVRYSGEDRILTFGQAGQAVSTFRDPIEYSFPLPEISNGLVQFADIDSDLDLDLLIGGDTSENGIMLIYQTIDTTWPLPDGSGEYLFKALEETATYLQAVQYPKASFGDLNSDGLQDLVISGISALNGEVETSIYRNNGTEFDLLALDGIDQVWGGAVEWGDFDNDGDDDLLVSGARNLEIPYDPVTLIYENLNGSLQSSGIELPGLVFGDVSWADIDGDNDLDIAMTGDQGGGDLFSAVFRNEGFGYVSVPGDFPKLTSGSVSWADFDVDGDLDLFITGGKLGPELLHGQAILFVNDGAAFSQYSFPFDGVLSGGAWWGDYENDGDPDLFVMGASKPLGAPVGRLFRNENGQFVAELDVEGLSNASVAFGDYNLDGDMDLVMSGRNDDGDYKVIFLINQQIPELIPGQ
ncbi:MAG: VCBS repeat-containing protein [Bacteroidetes Order II. Incertae sedis bacterium]|nr:VCBS repeat-containing protein [Bacteroidetes Order II. bacterium]